MARSRDYAGKEEAIVYDCEDGRLPKLRWDSQAITTCNTNEGARGQEDSSSHDWSPTKELAYSIGSCSSRIPALSSDDHGTPTLYSESDSSGSSPVDMLREHAFRSSRMTGTHDDDNDHDDSGEDVSGANPQKSIRVTSFLNPPFDGESRGNLTSRPIPSMNYVTKLTKRPSLTLSTKQFSGHSSPCNSPPSIGIVSSSSSSPCKQPTLRRKDGLNTFRRSAPVPEKEEPLLLGACQVTPRPQSQPSLSSSPSSFSQHPSSHKRNSSSISIPITSFQTHSRSYSQPNTVPLGHPNRPYYSAIRKDMSPSPDAMTVAYSRPASPMPPLFPFPNPNCNHATMPSPQGLNVIVSSAQDMDDLVSELSVSPLPFGYGSGLSSAGAGASTSVGTESSQSTSTFRKHRKERHQSAPALSRKEEMELRLALARNVRGPMEDPDVGRQPGATDSLKRKMDKLRKGFRDLWRCRS